MTPEVYIDFINKFDVDKVALTNDEILNAIEDGLKMQGEVKLRSNQERIFVQELVLKDISMF